MSCTKHFLFFSFTHHDWQRTVSWAENHADPETDMWGRATTDEFVTCKTQYRCARCGATTEAQFCGCDKSRGDCCKIRLDYLNGATPQAPELHQ